MLGMNDTTTAGSKLVQKNEKHEKFVEKVKGYTTTQIGRKISENTKPYTEDEIESKNLIIKSPAILRILTKWCEELWNKFETEKYFTNRAEPIQLQNPEIINPFFKWMKGKVDDMMNREKQKILEFKAKIDKSNYDQQTFLLFKNLQEDGITSVPQL